MERQFTMEHYKHLKENTFNPKICLICQGIDAILKEIARRTEVEKC